jgi:glycosyltransferase involved in cell wall biosynthesis
MSRRDASPPAIQHERDPFPKAVLPVKKLRASRRSPKRRTDARTVGLRHGSARWSLPSGVRAKPTGKDEAVDALALTFWTSAGLLLYSQVGYPLLLAVISRARRGIAGRRKPSSRTATARSAPSRELHDPVRPFVSIIVAAYAEESVIARRVKNLIALDYPRDRFEVIVSCDGSPDRTAERARAAGADVVLDRPRAGKVRAQDAGVDRARGEILAFGDANSIWEPGALQALVAVFEDPEVGYVCGEVKLINDGGTSQEGLYWRYEMVLRRLESDLRSVTAGNGAIYAARRQAYLRVDAVMGHDLSFPFNMVKRGWRAVYEPRAKATEKTVPSLEGEFARKRRFMAHTWPIVVRGGMLSPRGYDSLYALMIFSHRTLRYLSPVLHVTALATSLALMGKSRIYAAAAAGQLAVLGAGAVAPVMPARPLLIARHYILTTTSVAVGFWDWLTGGTSPGWEPVKEVR